LTYEKDDIVALARQIGSHDISLGVREYCAISHHSPATRSNVQQILNFENMLNSNGFYASLIDQLEQLDVEALTPEQIQYLQVVTDQIPPQAVIIDMRETSELHWSIPQPSIALSLSELIDRPEQLSADQTYLLVCEFGTQSIEIAYMLREMGYQTYAFDGGISKLQNFYKAHTDHKNFK
jgi:thiamine biosynthesis protein ThiI